MSETKTEAGYEVTLRLFVPANPKDRAQMRTATQVVDALEALKFEDLIAIEGAIVQKIETKAKHVNKRTPTTQE